MPILGFSEFLIHKSVTKFWNLVSTSVLIDWSRVAFRSDTVHLLGQARQMEKLSLKSLAPHRTEFRSFWKQAWLPLIRTIDTDHEWKDKLLLSDFSLFPCDLSSYFRISSTRWPWYNLETVADTRSCINVAVFFSLHRPVLCCPRACLLWYYSAWLLC